MEKKTSTFKDIVPVILIIVGLLIVLSLGKKGPIGPIKQDPYYSSPMRIPLR